MRRLLRPAAAATALFAGNVFLNSACSPADGNCRKDTKSDTDKANASLPLVKSSVLECIGNTPLIELQSLSSATGCRILVKAEHMNPGGSVKDRPALRIIESAERDGRLKLGGTIVEGTGGNTGVGMALVAAAKGYKAIFTMPANTAPEKVSLMETLGAQAIVCPTVPFSDEEQHYYHRAKAIAAATPGAVWGNQFEGKDNMMAHYTGTGPEIWAQSGGKVDAIALAAGTGGTIAGISTYLRERNPALKVFLIDPPGSALASLVRTGELTPSAGPTIVEGIGIGRLTANFAAALPHVDGAFDGTDAEAVDMAYFLLRNEGLFVGPSAALNVVGAVKAARQLGPGHTVVTVICDGGDRYRSKLYSPAWLAGQGLAVGDIDSPHAKAKAAFVK